GSANDVAYNVDEVAMAKLDRRNIHRDARGSELLLHPTPVIRHGLAQCPSADIEDHAGFLEHRNELERRDKPEVGALPTHQGFDADNTPRLDVDIRLVVQHELVLVQRASQLAPQREVTG